MNGDALGTVLPLLLGLVLLAIVALSAWLALTLTRRSSGGGESAEGKRPSSAPSDGALLRLYRDEHGLWAVEVRGRPYGDLTEVEDRALRDEVLEGIRYLAVFGKRYATQQREQAKGEKPSPAVATQGETAARTGLKPKLELVYGDRQAKQARRPAMRPSRPPALLPQIDLAKEIGDILEEMQAAHPTLRERTIRLQNAPEGGVLFVVDGLLYEAVEAIPDGEVRALIRAATRAWEERVG
jgi:hypothetical protein